VVRWVCYDGVPAFAPGCRVLGVFIPLDAPESRAAAAARVDTLCAGITAGAKLDLPAQLRACVLHAYLPVVGLMAQVGNLSTSAAAIFDNCVLSALASALPDKSEASRPYTAGLPPLLPPMATAMYTEPLLLGSALCTAGATARFQRGLCAASAGVFWSRIVPLCASIFGAIFAPTAVFIDNAIVAPSRLKAALAEIFHRRFSTPPPSRPPGEAASALLGRAGTHAVLNPSSWNKLVRTAYGHPEPAPLSGICPLCRRPCGVEHAFLCTNPDVAAARTRRHYILARFIANLISSCPLIGLRLEPHVHKPGTPPHARRADLLFTFYTTGETILVDLKIINEYAKSYAPSPAAAAAAKQRASLVTYRARTQREDVRIWVFTAAGALSSHASTDIARIASLVGMPRECLIARLYAIVLNTNSAVSAAYFKRVNTAL
jgi:hypothetical protein